MAHHTAAVARAKPAPLIVGDLPWMSYHVSTERDRPQRRPADPSRRPVREARGRRQAGAAWSRRIVDAEIPVMGHIGLTPAVGQRHGRVQGAGPRVGGRVGAGRRRQGAPARRLLRARASRACPTRSLRWSPAPLDIPTIGIGAGPRCDGQVLVMHDLLGIEDRVTPKFVRRYADVKGDLDRGRAALRRRRPRRPLPRPRRELPPQRRAGRGDGAVRRPAYRPVDSASLSEGVGIMCPCPR